MNKDIAREIIRASFKCGSELESLLPALKKGCSAKDYNDYTRRVAKAIDGIQSALLNDTLKRFPELKSEIEQNLKRTGRAMP